MKKRVLALIVILILLLILVLIFLILKPYLFEKTNLRGNKGNETNAPETLPITNQTNATKNITNPPIGGGGGGGSSGGNGNPPAPDKCKGIICNEGYVCKEGACIVNGTICSIAQENNLCEGLNMTYVEGYREECHSKYGKC